MRGYLHNNSCFMVVLAKFRRTTSLAFLEDAIEIAKVVETTTETDFGNGMSTIDEHTAGIPQALVDNILAEVSACMEFEETAESRRTHASDIGYLPQTDFILIMLFDEILHLLNPTAVARHLNLCKAA